MSSQNLLRARRFTSLIVFILAFFVQVTVRAWDVDLSRRQKDLQKAQGPSSSVMGNSENPIENFLEAAGPVQEIVLLHTATGFVPETLRLRKGGSYHIHVVNVDEKDKNVSFILDAFAEHHGTYFGQPKDFTITPKADGVFTFQCPETAKQGHLVVYSDDAKDSRKPASN